jgi:single-stranded-DNA-specific exonuclease
LGTIADMVPQVQQNQEIIERGLRSLKNTFRPALRVFLEILGNGSVFEGSLPRIISALNAAESLNFENESYALLTSSDKNRCKEIAETLLNKNFNKQLQIKNIVQEVERRISQKPDQAVIFEGDPAWKLTMAGSVASIMCSKYAKPAFIFKKMDKESCGSVRNPKDTNSVDAMKTCSDFLITYGGHACASGFRVKNEDLLKFESKLGEYFKK